MKCKCGHTKKDHVELPTKEHGINGCLKCRCKKFKDGERKKE